MCHKRILFVFVIVLFDFMFNIQRAVAVMTEQVITHESIVKALSDVKTLQHDRRQAKEHEISVPSHTSLDLSKVNSSNEKTVFDTTQFEESLTMIQQQKTLFDMQIKQLADRYQILKQESLRQMASDKKRIEELTKRVAQMEKELTETKLQLQKAQTSLEVVKNSTQPVATVASNGNSSQQ